MEIKEGLLKENNAWEKYLINTFRSNEKDEATYLIEEESIGASFTWEKTKEGHSYWNRLNGEEYRRKELTS